MKAMILAAGQGTRLLPLTEKRPKSLVPIAGRAMIEYPLLLLRHYGIREIIINLHHLGEQLEDYLGSGERWDLHITYSKEPELLDTGGGLLKAKPFLSDGTFIVINTDVLIDLPLADVLEFHRAKKSTVTLVLRPDSEAERYGSIDVDSRGRVCRFLRTPAPVQGSGVLTTLMFTGVQVLEPKVFDYMQSQGNIERFSTTRDTYPRLLSAGEPCFGFSFHGYWQDLGTISRINEAEDRLARGDPKLHFL